MDLSDYSTPELAPPPPADNPQSAIHNPHSKISDDLALLANLPVPTKPDSDRRTGKIARLPKPVRDHLNAMLQDGVPYQQIMERLGPHGDALNEQNITNWKKGGYQDWLREIRLTNAI